MEDSRLTEWLGATPRWNREEVARQAGMDPEEARRLWVALGFPESDPAERLFTDDDVAALQATRRVRQLAGVSAVEAVALARSMGRALAVLATGQIEALVGRLGTEPALELAPRLLGELERLVVHVWRRQVGAAAERLAAAPEAGSAQRAVGFVDVVGYTRLSRELELSELVAFLDGFDSAASAAVIRHGGRVVKTIGDEVMWTVDTAETAARIGAELAGLPTPLVRVGVAYGRTVPSGGDVFGPVVNIAARLTRLARPGTCLVDREMATQLAGNPEFRLTPLRAQAVRGYPHLAPVALRMAARG